MTVFRTIRDMMRPNIRGNIRPDATDWPAPAAPVTGSLLLEDGASFFLLETSDKLLLE